jgi:hypothetical protein
MSTGEERRRCRRAGDPSLSDTDREFLGRLVDGDLAQEFQAALDARWEGRVALDEPLNRWPEWDIVYDHTELAPTSTVRGWELMPLITF